MDKGLEMDTKSIRIGFIKKWLKEKKADNQFNQAIVETIEKNLGGVNNEKLDEDALFNSVTEIQYGDKKNG